MQSIDSCYMILLQHTAAAYSGGTAGGFLGGLEDQKHVERRDLLRGTQILCQPQQDRHVSVMPAGVHAPRVAGGKGKTGRFRDGQCVHIAAESDGFRTMKVEISTHRVSPR